MFSNPLRLWPHEEESSCFSVFSGATTIRSLSSAEYIRRSCGCDCDRLPAVLVKLTPTGSLFVSSASWSSRCVSSSVSSAATVRSSTESPQSLASGSLSPSEVASPGGRRRLHHPSNRPGRLEHRRGRLVGAAVPADSASLQRLQGLQRL